MGREIGKLKQGEPLHAALKRDFERGKREYGISAESVGSDFGLGPDAIYKLVNEGAGRLPAEMKAVVAWHEATGGIEALKWIAAGCGCLVTRKPTGHRMEGNTGQVLHEVADLINEIGVALADNHMTAAEVARIEKEGAEAMAAIAAAMEQARLMAMSNGRAATLRETQHV